MSDHLEGLPVSAHTYNRHGCRCDDCKAERKKMTSVGRSKLRIIARNRAQSRAMRWMLRNHNEVWEQFLKEEVAIAEAEFPDLAVDRRRWNGNAAHFRRTGVDL